MRWNLQFSPRLPHVRTADTDRQVATWKNVFGPFLAVSLASCLFAVPANAQTATSTYVSGVGLDTNPCTAVAPCRTLQTALGRTSPGGQIYSLDSANYGYVSIKMSVSILSGRGVTGVLATSSLTGLNINAGANDVITLQGLDIDGAGSGASGIQFTSGAALNIQDSVIRGFTNGINFQPGGASSLLVSKTLISNNSTGINLHGAAASTAVLNDVQLVGNGTGLAATGASSTASANVTLQNSVIANNRTVGVAAGASSAVSIASSTVTNNAVGLQAQASSSLVQASKSTLTGNRTAWQAANGGQVLSASNNAFGGNTGGDTGPPAANAPAPPPPAPVPSVAVTCNFITGIATGVGGGTCIPSPPRCDGVTDNTAAFTAFTNWAVNTWQATNTGQIELFIPSGVTCTYNGGIMFALGRGLPGIKNLIVMAYGATLTGTFGNIGMFGQYQDRSHSVRTLTANAGDTYVTINPSALSQPQNGCIYKAANPIASCLAIFHVGQWAMMGGFDLQAGVGFPSNQGFFQFVHITAIDNNPVSPTYGRISFDAPLNDAYKATWPSYNVQPGCEPQPPCFDGLPDYGGPATLFAFEPSWDATLEWRGITLKSTNPNPLGPEVGMAGRDVIIRDVSCPAAGQACLFPSQNKNVAMYNVSSPLASAEPDKLVETWTFDGGTYNTISFQSSSIKNVIFNNVSTNTLVGAPENITISNSTISTFRAGATTYGRTKSVNVSNSIIETIGSAGSHLGMGVEYAGTFASEGLNNLPDWSINASGVITISNAWIIANQFSWKGWNLPGTYACWGGAGYTCAEVWQVTDVTQDATNTYIHTTATTAGGGWPKWTGLTKLGIEVYPALSFTCTGCNGDLFTVGLNGVTAPLYSYNKVTFQSADTASTVQYFPLFGNLTKINATVNTAYTGSLTAGMAGYQTGSNWFDPTTFSSGTLGVVSYTPATIFNWKSASPGLRSLDATTGSYPHSWTGANSGDSLATLTRQLWSANGFEYSMTNLSSDPTHPLSTTVEVFTDPGIVP